jgi:dolichol-phosphate mannosyltransferase
MPISSLLYTSINMSLKTVTKDISFSELRLSIIIPVFNQQNKITHSIKRIKQAVELWFNNYELIIVNDGSTDNTLTFLKCIELTDQRIHILSYTPNRGKGYAVRQGVLHSQGDVVMFLDGDLDISPDSIKDYVESLSTADLVIASKRHPQSSVTIPKSRALLSIAFNLLIRLATGIPQKDTQAGFKVGKGEIMRTIFRSASINRYAFDVELFTIASILHLTVHEMPVMMKIDRRFNTKEIVRMLADVARISYKHRIAHQYQHEYQKDNNI